MAEVNVNSLITPDRSESGESVSSDNGCSRLLHDQRISFSSGDDVHNARRNSTGKPSPTDSNHKVVPHYLRASTGSCHDFCKFGRKEAFEEKKRYPLWKRTITAVSNKQNPVGTTAQGEMKKPMAFKTTTSARSKSPSLGPKAALAVVQSPDPPEIIKREVSTSKKFEVSLKPPLSAEKKMLKTEKKSSPEVHSPSVQPRLTKKSKKISSNSSEKHSSSMQPELMKQSKKIYSNSSEKHSPSQQPELMKQSKKKIATKFQEPSPSMQPKLRQQSRKKINTISEKLPQSEEPQLIKQTASSYPLESGKETKKAEKGMRFLRKKIYPSPQPQPVTAKLSPSSQIPGGIAAKGRRQDSIKTGKITLVSKSPAKKTLLPSSNSASTRCSTSITISPKAGKPRGSKLISSPLSRNRMQKAAVEEAITEKVPEKTLHVVEMDNKSIQPELAGDSDVIPSLSSQSCLSPDSLSEPQSSSLPSHEEEEEDEVETEEEEEEEEVDIEHEEEGEENGNSCGKAEDLISEKTANTNGIKAVGDNCRKTPRRGPINSESRDSMAVKLRFRRGKVVDVRSESSGPRRLRFRRARVIEENHDSKNEMRRKFIKKKGDDGGHGNDTNISDKKVVLRHQDSQEKKDAQGLFNNVIEETASKLVESQKSKVKALVGAFETVISLQEKKPSSQPAP
ncbi:hypothetical protein M9H77_15552 [Catharanthus roseus]|uniref:Uncharacterized protein n=1 Tax=Catharanthus roseus TaxID=4058 RepID=A0ACC0AZW1_CATRO|nr:hypothetical protein M9H77_15552 [Catharanthus roseus]